MTGSTCAPYLRVSTQRQADHDLSIPDQRNQIMAYIEKRGWTVVEEFVESGASGRDENCPVLQEMLAQALQKPPPFSNIVVHSMSRFFRDAMWFEYYRRKLEKNGVAIHSITQDFGEGTAAHLTRQIMALTDEMNSVENAKHVRRTMLENARQGFWNGSVAPLGYRTVVAELRGQKEKKKLEIDGEGAETIKLIFRLYLEGDGASGPLGIKSIVSYLNERGYRTPKGNPFHTSFVGKLLTDEVYVGRAYYNKIDSRTRQDRPREEWITVPVPSIIREADFQRVQNLLSERSPKRTPPRLVNSPVLLTGVAVCGGCGGPLSRRTGKGGAYAYYRCSGKQRQGHCAGGLPAGIPTATLDQIVVDRVLDEVLTPERVQAIVAEVAALRASGADDAVMSLNQLKAQRAKSVRKLENLINVLAEGIVDATETFKATVKAAEADCDRLATLIANQARLIDAQMRSITLEEAAIAATELRERLIGSAPSLKKRIVRSFVDQVIVTADEIVILGAKSALAEVVTGTPLDRLNLPPSPVPTFGREWWSRGESNP